MNTHKWKPMMLVLICVLIVTCLAVSVFYVWPRTVDLSVEGVLFRYEETSFQETPVTLQLRGTLKRSLAGERRFQGEMALDGWEWETPEYAGTLQLYFPENEAIVMYHGYREGQFFTDVRGILFTDVSFQTFALALHEPIGMDEGRRRWSAPGGLIASMPADTREQATEVALKLIPHLHLTEAN